ncbi:MAG: hypothetical protein MI799_16275 [Desulfobacterales bacterium]|nr:hypothetical protein [Desulfobacterales bacterium]
MAESVQIKPGDNINRILKSKRGIVGNSVFKWLSDVRKLNPHISNLDRIYPGEHILIPDKLNEHVPDNKIWENALAKIPIALQQPQSYAHSIYFCNGCQSIDVIAEYMFSKGRFHNMSLSSKRAVLIFKNPCLMNYLPNNNPPFKTALEISPTIRNYSEVRQWLSAKPNIEHWFRHIDINLNNMCDDVGAEPAFTMAQIVESLKNEGAAVDFDDAIKGAGYGVAGASGHASAGILGVNTINGLMRELYLEIIEKFGSKIVHSKKASDLAKIQQFLKASPKYTQLMGHLNNVPKHLLAKLNLTSVNPNAHFGTARHFRKHISMPLKKWGNSSKYLNSTVKQLNGRLNLLKGVGRAATWYIPAILGVASVAAAPTELRAKRAFEEGFGVLGGAGGAHLGMYAGLGIVFILGLGPFGMFVAVFICASAGGLIGMDAGNWFGGQTYDIGTSVQTKFYHSIDDLFIN